MDNKTSGHLTTSRTNPNVRTLTDMVSNECHLTGEDQIHEHKMRRKEIYLHISAMKQPNPS